MEGERAIDEMQKVGDGKEREPYRNLGLTPTVDGGREWILEEIVKLKKPATATRFYINLQIVGFTVYLIHGYLGNCY